MNPADFYMQRESSLSSRGRGRKGVTTVWEPELDGRGGGGGKAARMARYVVEEEEEEPVVTKEVLVDKETKTVEKEEKATEKEEKKEMDCWWIWILIAILIGSVSVLVFRKKEKAHQYRLFVR